MTEFTYRRALDAAFRSIIRDKLASMPPTQESGRGARDRIALVVDTTASGVGLPTWLRHKYPETITLILQHQYWDMTVRGDHFEVVLGFNGNGERLHIPFSSILAFVDEVANVKLAMLHPSSRDAADPAMSVPIDHPKVVSLDAFRRK